MLIYKQTDSLEVIGYFYLDFSGCINTKKSTFWYIFILTSGTIFWSSKKYILTITSTMEAEFVSYFKAISHGLWFKSFIYGFRIMNSVVRPLKLFCDNFVMVFMAKNSRSESQSKHIDIKYLAIKKRTKLSLRTVALS